MADPDLLNIDLALGKIGDNLKRTYRRIDSRIGNEGEDTSFVKTTTVRPGWPIGVKEVASIFGGTRSVVIYADI